MHVVSPRPFVRVGQRHHRPLNHIIRLELHLPARLSAGLLAAASATRPLLAPSQHEPADQRGPTVSAVAARSSATVRAISHAIITLQPGHPLAAAEISARDRLSRALINYPQTNAGAGARRLSRARKSYSTVLVEEDHSGRRGEEKLDCPANSSGQVHAWDASVQLYRGAQLEAPAGPGRSCARTTRNQRPPMEPQTGPLNHKRSAERRRRADSSAARGVAFGNAPAEGTTFRMTRQP